MIQIILHIRDAPFVNDESIKVNPSTSRPEGPDLLRVDPEQRFFTPPFKAGFGATEWVK
jgi:hypothetical protein